MMQNRPPEPPDQQQPTCNNENVAPQEDCDATVGGEDDNLATWLASLQLDQYLPTFTAAALDLDVIQWLDEDNLREMGVALGDRKRLVKAIRDLGNNNHQGDAEDGDEEDGDEEDGDEEDGVGIAPQPHFNHTSTTPCTSTRTSTDTPVAHNSPFPSPQASAPKRLRQMTLTFVQSPTVGQQQLGLQQPPPQNPPSQHPQPQHPPTTTAQRPLWPLFTPGANKSTSTPAPQQPLSALASLPAPGAAARRAVLLASSDTVRGKGIGAQGPFAPNKGPFAPNARTGGGRGGGRHSARQPNTEGAPRARPRLTHAQLPPWQAVLHTPRMVVDRFGIDYEYCGAQHWVLTHFHADHYKGLTKQFHGGRIYCTTITAKLVQLKLRVPSTFLHPLPMDTPTDIEGVQVTLVDANHCPGAAMVVFEPRNRLPIVHTGDCRCHTDMQRNQHLLRVRGACDLVLDTTYCDPRYTFPTQQSVMEYCLHAVRAELFNGPRTLVVFGTYTIGKERLFLHVAEALQKKVYVNKAKYDILQCCELPPSLANLLTTDPTMTNLHALPLFMVNHTKLKSLAKQYPQYDVVVGFQPTGWSFGPPRAGRGGRGGGGGGAQEEEGGRPATRSQRGKIILYQVAYSEHSSYNELREFVRWLQPRNIIPSVNNDRGQRERAMLAMLR